MSDPVAPLTGRRGGEADERAGRSQREARAALLAMSNGYWVTQVVYVAAKLRMADLLAERPRRIEELAEATGTDLPSLRRVMRALVRLGVFDCGEEGAYALTPLGELLRADSDTGLWARAVLNGEVWYSAWGRLLEGVRTGTTPFELLTGGSFFRYVEGSGAEGAVFDRAMATSTRQVARRVGEVYAFPSSCLIVDVGGGTGTCLATVLQAHPGSRGVLFDRANVVTGARDVLEEAGVAERCQVVEGDFFEFVPAGGDVYLLSWILHDWDDDTSERILTNCRRAMGPGSRLLVLEEVLAEDGGDGSLEMFDLHMLVTSGGRERSEQQYRELLSRSGLEMVQVLPTGLGRSVIEAVPVDGRPVEQPTSSEKKVSGLSLSGSEGFHRL